MKRDPRAMYWLALDCGHRVQGPVGAETKRCKTCSTMQQVLSVGDLIRPALDPSVQTDTRVHGRADGLTVRHIRGEGLRIWWCRFCYSKRPHKAYRNVVTSMDEVFEGWDRHKVSSHHLKSVETASRIEAIARLADQ